MDLPVFKERQELISNVKARYLEKGVSCVITKGSNKRRVVIKCCHGGSNDKRSIVSNELRITSISCMQVRERRMEGF